MSNCICSNLISIIIPAYNICNELGPCLDSILAQTHTNIEVIIVNDGSKDGTASVMEHYATLDSRVKVIHKENGGVTSARLRGVREAQGTWIGFVDGDDRIEPQMYAHLLENAQKYDADISHCGYQMVYPSRIDLYYGTGRLVEQSNEDGMTDLIGGKFIEPALVTKLYKKDLFTPLLQDSLMDPTIKNFEDLLMNFYLFRDSNKSVYEDFCPYLYILRLSSAATSKLNEHKVLDPIRVSKILLRECSDSPGLLAVTQVKLLRQYINVATISLGEHKAWLSPIRKTIRTELRSFLPAMKTCPVCSRSLYFMGLWAAYSPLTYGWVHSLHGMITGNNRKYEVK